MSRARQTRRIARETARRLGAAAGEENALDFASGSGGCDPAPTPAELRAANRHSWDEGAINAGAAKFDRCPAGFETDYYEAYELAAHALTERLAIEAVS